MYSYLQCFLIQSARAVRLSRESRLSIILYSSCQDLCLCFSMIVANSSPLPNIDHTMCLMGGRMGGGEGGRPACGNDFLLQCASKTRGCTSTECFHACFLCRVWEKRVNLYLKEITIYNLSCVCVCVVDESIPVNCVWVCVWAVYVCVFSAVSSSSAYRVLLYSVFQCSDLLRFQHQATGSTPVEQDGRRLVASCRVVLANLLLRWRGFHHSLPLEKQKRCSAAPRAKTHWFMTWFPSSCTMFLFILQKAQSESFSSFVHLMGRVISDMHTPSCPPSCCCQDVFTRQIPFSFLAFVHLKGAGWRNIV